MYCPNNIIASLTPMQASITASSIASLYFSILHLPFILLQPCVICILPFSDKKQ